MTRPTSPAGRSNVRLKGAEDRRPGQFSGTRRPRLCEWPDVFAVDCRRACVRRARKASENPDVLVYWPRHETSHLNKVERDVVEEAIANFGDPFQGPR
jgi:hypothetical protein